MAIETDIVMYKVCSWAMSSLQCCLSLNPLSASFLDGVRNDFMHILAKPLFHQLFEIHQVKLLPIGNKKNPVEMFKRL